MAEFYWTWICPECKENRDKSNTVPNVDIFKTRCQICKTKVIPVRIYLTYLEGFPSHKIEEV